MLKLLLNATFALMIAGAGLLAMTAGYGTAMADDCSVTVGDVTVTLSCDFGAGFFSGSGISGSVGG